VGHTHEDIDQLIGAIVTYLRTRNLPTVEILITALKLALHDEEGKVKDVVLVIGVTDYDELFAGVRTEGLQGISEAKVLRFSANELGKELFRSLHPETDGIVTSIDINGMDSIERQSTRARRYNNDIICLIETFNVGLQISLNVS